MIYWCLFIDPNSSSLVILIYIMKTNYLLITSLDLLETLFRIFFLIGIHYMQGWTATLRHGVTKKRSTKILKYQMKPVEFFQHWNPQAISCTSLKDGGGGGVLWAPSGSRAEHWLGSRKLHSFPNSKYSLYFKFNHNSMS